MKVKFLKDEDNEDFDVGDTVTVEASIFFSDAFDETEAKTNISTVEITIEDYDGTKDVDAAAMSNNDTGEYFYDWDTTGLSAGDYKVTVEATNSSTEKEVAYIRLKA